MPGRVDLHLSQSPFLLYPHIIIRSNLPVVNLSGVSGKRLWDKTGPTWPKRQGGPHAQLYIREIRPLHGHPITTVWREFLKDVQAYLDAELGVKFTAIMGVGFANAKDETPFCPLLVIIGVPPNSLPFEAAKKTADYVKGTILSQAGFPAVDVAVREWVTILPGCGPKLPSLDPLVDSVAEFRHHFTSTLGLSVASAKTPYYEGTVALYLRCGNDNDDVIAITAAHLSRDAFDWAKFKGNKVYIGGNIKEEEYGSLMFPNHSDRASYRYPPDGLLQVFYVVLKSEIQQPKQRHAPGDNAMPDYDLEFTALETTILSYGGRGAFSGQGDSGVIILDRGGRIVAMLTGGGGSTNESNVTFGTAWYELESHIRKALPGYFLYPVVSGR
ncbi:hypothetical protein C7212DRAFT_344986 [Tuber magnatum]|uniref:Peptidase S1 domain-containing protein n=1 Tax=Tuber magnatum TaxID=42249 RepID=A0A317SL75_9PEZI|nr:hypothetical protein C7212DRAFT_344986 [Tuber magnatum]